MLKVLLEKAYSMQEWLGNIPEKHAMKEESNGNARRMVAEMKHLWWADQQTWHSWRKN